jgi:hypothetical protein
VEKTATPRIRLRRGQKVALVAVIVLLVATVLTTPTVEPLRGNFWKAWGANCGTVTSSYNRDNVVAGGTPNEQCLQRAAQRCEAASLTFDQLNTDAEEKITLVVEPAVPHLLACGIAAVWTSHGVFAFNSASGVEHCANVELQADGLHANGCGRLGEIVVPAH